MFTTTLANKDKYKFVNWFIRLKIDERRFIVKAIQTFTEEKGQTTTRTFIYNEYLKLRNQATDIFEYLQDMGLERLIVNSSFTELVMNYRPFTYNEGAPSEYWQKIKTIEQYEND